MSNKGSGTDGKTDLANGKGPKWKWSYFCYLLFFSPKESGNMDFSGGKEIFSKSEPFLSCFEYRKLHRNHLGLCGTFAPSTFIWLFSEDQ